MESQGVGGQAFGYKCKVWEGEGEQGQHCTMGVQGIHRSCIAEQGQRAEGVLRDP